MDQNIASVAMSPFFIPSQDPNTLKLLYLRQQFFTYPKRAVKKHFFLVESLGLQLGGAYSSTSCSILPCGLLQFAVMVIVQRKTPLRVSYVRQVIGYKSDKVKAVQMPLTETCKKSWSLEPHPGVRPWIRGQLSNSWLGHPLPVHSAEQPLWNSLPIGSPLFFVTEKKWQKSQK